MSKQNEFQELQVDQQAKQLPSTTANDQTIDYKRNYGKGIILKRDKDGEPICMLGPHYYIFIIAFIVCVSLMCLMLYSLHGTLSPLWFYLLCACTFVFALSYINIGTSVPGIASKAEDPAEYVKQEPRYCRKCRIVRQRGVHHCQDCDVCIQGHDHHCPWIGKCVGSNNLCAFYFFLIMIFGTLIMCFVATLASGGVKSPHLNTNDPKNPTVLKFI